MTDFVDLPITTSESDLRDIAIARLQAIWPDWTPNDGDPELINIEAHAPLAANAAAMAANMPAEALRALGRLIGIPYSLGSASYTTVRLTMQDNNGYTVGAGSELNIDGYAFALTDDVVCPAGAVTADALVACTTPTAAANGLTGAAALAPISLPLWVVGLSVLAATSNGADPDTEDSYLDKVSRDRRLINRAIVTLLDVELAALDVPGVGRARADKDTSRNVTVTITDVNGEPTNAATKTALLTMFAAARTVNVNFFAVDATYTTVSVTYTVVRESGIDPTNLLTRCNAALSDELSPAGFGVPNSGDPSSSATTWIVDAKVYAWRLVAVLTAVAGVRRVSAVAINGGANGADFTLPGSVPLPRPGAFTGTAT